MRISFISYLQIIFETKRNYEFSQICFCIESESEDDAAEEETKSKFMCHI